MAAIGLIEGVERLGGDLADATAKVDALLAEVERDVAAARPRGRRPRRPAPVTRPSGTALARPSGCSTRREHWPVRRPGIRSQRSSGRSPRTRRSTPCSQRSPSRQRRRSGRGPPFAATLASARTRLDRARDYIATRRHGVGDRARMQVAEAERLVAEAGALADTDRPGRSSSRARRNGAPTQAYTTAAQEFEGWQTRRRAGGGPYAGPSGGDIVGSILGGILGGVLSGGMRGSGWGGSPWGSPWPGGPAAVVGWLRLAGLAAVDRRLDAGRSSAGWRRSRRRRRRGWRAARGGRW